MEADGHSEETGNSGGNGRNRGRHDLDLNPRGIQAKKITRLDRLNLLPSKIFCSIGPAVDPNKSHKYFNMYLVDSVLPAPDSPETMMDCDCFNTFISRNDLSASKKI